MGVTRGALPFVAFTQVRNAWLRDERISYKAKGLLGYLSSHAEGYRLSQTQIVRQGTDGRDSVVSGLAELERAGYLVRSRERRASGGRFAEDEFTLADPFDASGKLLPTEPREIRISYENEPRKIHQGGKSASGDPHREIRPVEEQGENIPPAPTEQGGAGGQLELLDGAPAATRAKPRRRIPDDWQPSPGVRVNADQRWPGWEQRETIEEFRDYWLAAGRPMADWDLTWRNRVRELAARGGNGYRSTPNRSYGPLMDIPTDADAHRGAF